MTRSQAAAFDAEIPRQRRQAGDGARTLPAVRALVHGAAAEEDHRRLRRRIPARERGDAARLDPRRRGRPGRVVPLDVSGESIEPDGVSADERGVVQPLCDDHVHHAQRQGGIAPGADQQRLVGLRRGFGAPHVDVHHVRAAALRGREVAPGVRLAGERLPPEDDEVGVGAHVLLRVHLEDAGEAQPEGAEAPADHRRAPPLAAVEVGEAPQQLGGEPGAVVVGEEPVPAPRSDGGGTGGARAPGDAVERVVPGGALPRSAARGAPERMEKALRIADDLARGVAADAEKAAAVGVFGIAADGRDASVFQIDQHPAERRMTVHRTHGADGAQHRLEDSGGPVRLPQARGCGWTAGATAAEMRACPTPRASTAAIPWKTATP